MPAIGDLNYGYDAGGMQTYLDAIHADCIEAAKTAVKNTDGIKTVCDEHWEGKAKENFKINLDKDAAHVCDQFDALYNILVSEINSLQAAMANKDEELIEAD